MSVLRHEWKHEINYLDMLVIRARMRAISMPDPHAVDGKYLIRSLYFDTPSDKALREKIDGVDKRKKYRIRFYNNDLSFIRLERKSKWNNLGAKDMAALTPEMAQAIADGSIDWMADDPSELIRELFVDMRTTGLRAKTIVDYTREPFIFPAGNVRVTLDYDIRTGLGSKDFLNPETPMVPIVDNPIILEVKWDEFLPEIIRDAVHLENRRAAAFSKYAACRMYD
ncbi:MAG: polyphosphate polymerase domain-containing protein [Lachnospiraceae bacterium]|nr:polyphosphate polymerase domain-containing protein [Lachnospiraceae bacterium]